MSFVFDTITSAGRQVRIVSDCDAEENPTFAVMVDGTMYSGFMSRVTALAAARRIIGGVSS